MGYRINERNTGNWSLNSEPKRKRTKTKVLSTDQKNILVQVLEKVLFCLEHDKTGKGHLSPESRWIDAGNFTISLTGNQMNQLYETLEKIRL